MGKWYKITGITKELFELWATDFRKDILFWEGPDEMEARIELSLFEAIFMKIRMMFYNRRHPYKFHLEKLGFQMD